MAGGGNPNLPVFAVAPKMTEVRLCVMYALLPFPANPTPRASNRIGTLTNPDENY
jgi:hypothetical protein